MEDENQPVETSLRDDLVSAVAEVKEREADPVDTPEKVEARDDKGRFKNKEDTVKAPKGKDDNSEAITNMAQVTPVKEVEAPVGLSAAAKAKWKELPQEVRDDIIRREEDSHRLASRQDEDRILGTKLKEIITPYMAQIRSEGGTAEGAVSDLLNTAYQLRTAPPNQKAQLVQQIIKAYGVDMNLISPESQGYVDPTIQELQNQIAQLQKMANPATITKQLQEKMENDRIGTEVNAFASDPANVHYQTVKATMASLLGTGQAANLKEAYEMACFANPSIRSTLLAQQQTDETAKRKQEMEAKKKAGSSITGSPGTVVANSGSPERTLREEIAHNLREARLSSI